MSDLFWLSDAQMARLDPQFLPKSYGKPKVDDRRVLGGDLVAPFKMELCSDQQYRLRAPVGCQLTKAERAFQTWLVATVQTYQARVKQVLDQLEIKVITE